MKGTIPNIYKATDQSSLKNNLSEIKFNLSQCNLACFKGKLRSGISKNKAEQMITPVKQKSLGKQIPKIKGLLEEKYYPRQRLASTLGSFNEKVVFMHYDNYDVYVDNSSRKKSIEQKSKKSDSRGKKEEVSDAQLQFLCLRVITEETDNTSNNLSKSAYQTPQSLKSHESAESFIYTNYSQLGEYPRSNFIVEKPLRNRRSVTIQESKKFVIDFENIEIDGRTTIMVKNIPNKYTQEMLLEEFSTNNMNKFDFFYLPIDKDNQCNIGYAFLNFINTSFIKHFYLEFHKKKWKKYKSPKICQLYYARYQGTLELAHHFQHTKIISKDKKIRPLIGLGEANRIKQIVHNQRIKQ